MIINFHPKEIPSKKGIEIINRLNQTNQSKIVHSADLSSDEWKSIIKSDEELILVAPVFWWGLGYEFDKWAQDVLSYDFAYRYTEDGALEGLLKGRKFTLHLTHGTPKEYAENMRNNIKERVDAGIFGFCNSKVDVHFYDLND